MTTLAEITRSLDDIAAADTLESLDAHRVALLGRNGAITVMLKSLGALAPDERKARGAEVNRAKEAISDAIAARRTTLEQAALDQRLSSERIDITLPGRRGERGGLHPITRTLDRMTGIFARLGYDLADGPEIEDDFHNFGALNIPAHHPARAMHDTFYVKNGSGVLRTHTSPVQIRTLEKMVKAGGTPPVRIIAPGRVYRSDSDRTHSPMFHQVEGLYVAENVSFADLQYDLKSFLSRFFEREAQRFHELAIYYRAELPPDVPFRRGGVAFETFDEGHRLRFEWVPVEAAALGAVNLLPAWMIERLPALPEAAQHLIMHELPR